MISNQLNYLTIIAIFALLDKENAKSFRFVMSAGKNIDKNIINVAGRIERLVADARVHIARLVNIAEVITKYEIGRIIVEIVQEGEERATYGKPLLQGVSGLLTERLGKGWSVETLKICRRFYQIYSAKQIRYTPSTQLPAEDSVDTVYQIQKSATLSRKSDATYPFPVLVALKLSRRYRRL